MNIPRIVVCDLDGTFIPKHSTMTGRAKKDLRLLQEKGCKFGIASGRPLFQIEDQVKSWGVHYDFIIGYNGATLYDANNNKHYTYFQMSKEQIKQAFDMMEGFDYNPGAYTQDNTISGVYDDMVKASEKYQGKKQIIYDDWDKFLDLPAKKIMFRIEESKMEEAEKVVKERCPKGLVVFKTGPRLLEVTVEGCSKAYALKKYCEIEGIDMKDVAAFGDTSNDNEMLIESGLGVCLANGSSDTKEVADIVTDLSCDDDGWADFVEKQFLLPNKLITQEEIIPEEIKEGEFFKFIQEIEKK